MLATLIEVMASAPVGETKFVDLYANHGNADPLIVANAVDGHRREAEALFGPTWTVVSGDKAVRVKAEAFGLAAMSNEEFPAMLEHLMAAGG